MKIEDLTLEERETHIWQNATDRSVWYLDTDDPVMMGKMEKIGAEFVEEIGVGKRYKLNNRQLSLKKPREISEEKRAEIAERLRKGREKKKEDQ